MSTFPDFDVDKIPEEYRILWATHFNYGTAGFRERADLLPTVVFRTGLLAALRSRYHKGQAVGVMITASHNPPEDNGVKIVEPNGHMLDEQWEKHAVTIANVPDSGLKAAVDKIIAECAINDMYSAMVLCARDTRQSSPKLRKAVQSAADLFVAGFKSFEELTTPQFHFMVKKFNEHQKIICRTPEVDPVDISAYFEKTVDGFIEIVGTKSSADVTNGHGDAKMSRVFIDAANGVGAQHVVTLERYLRDRNAPLTIELQNVGPERLNSECGADYVKIGQKFPKFGSDGKEVKLAEKIGQTWASFDGDADRIVFFFVDKDAKFHLLDGDKIATLFASFLGELLADAKIVDDVKLGLVQTAYANGSSTAYIQQQLRLDVYCVPTGVKHLHKKAEELDVGVYFEANGHGTVTFSDKFGRLVEEKFKNADANSNEGIALTRIRGFMNLINETVGDAISDLLAVEAILYIREWSVGQWDGAYTDLPSRQLKVKVPDRTLVQTTDAERVCTKPDGLQNEIDKLVKADVSGKARAFVRPSGTENIVRVYAESATQETTDELAKNVSGMVTKFCS